MNRWHRYWALLLPYLVLVVGVDFLHHHNAQVGTAPGPGWAITASDDAYCPACHWLVSSAAVVTDSEGAVGGIVVPLPGVEPSESYSHRIQLPPSRAPPSA